MDRTVCRITGVSDSASHNRKFPIINKCPFFKVDDLRLVEDWHDDTSSTASFHIITPIDGPVEVGRDDRTTSVPAGSSCLVPAVFGEYGVHVASGSGTTVIRTTL
jgi:mannose-6-phosphate isomerase class I